MGQAKRNRNKQTNNTLQTIDIAAFYKENTNDGLMISWLPIIKSGALTFEVVETALSDMMRTYARVVSTGERTEQQLHSELVTQLETEVIPNLLVDLYGITDGKYPARGSRISREFEITDQLVMLMMVFTSTIHWLEQKGYIVNDNFNGLMNIKVQMG